MSSTAKVSSPPPGFAPQADTTSPRARTVTWATLRRYALWLLLLAVVVAAALYVARWWMVGRFVPDTDDAYLNADTVIIAPKVGGYVSAVLVEDNQDVQAGQPLVRIDPQNYDATLARQQANLDARTADIATAEAQVQQQRAMVVEAQARLVGSSANARYAGAEAARYRKLNASGAETAQMLDEMVNNRDQADATIHAATASVLAAERQVATLQAQIGQARAQREAAEAAVHEAALDRQNTVVVASIAGRIGDRAVRVGAFVQPGTRLLSIVPVQAIYVTANFKETQLSRMRPGQRARVSIDALDGREVDGVVDSFAPGTGSQFALLPPENATGNFTKIVQRVPVRIRLQTDAATRALLLPGLSVTVEVDTRNSPHS